MNPLATRNRAPYASLLARPGFAFWTLQIGGWSAYGLLIFITLVPVMAPGGDVLYLLFVKFVRTALGFTVSLGMRSVYRALRARSAPAGMQAVSALACSVLFGTVWAVVYKIFGAMMSPKHGDLFAWSLYPRDVLDYSYVLFAWSASYFGIKYWQDLQREKERALEATALAHQAQLEMLRYQINPHFLFNALNSIRASIEEDRGRAKRMVTELSEFLRYSLLEAKSAEVPLSEEIEAIRNYLTIERIRFEDKLEVTFDVEPAAESFPVPSFIVHPLVENAIKHGMRAGTIPLEVRLVARVENGALTIEVANTGRLGRAEAAGARDTGIGLTNIRRRLEEVFQERGRFDIFERDGWTRAVIKIQRQS